MENSPDPTPTSTTANMGVSHSTARYLAPASFIYDFIVPKDPLFPWYLFKNFREFSALPVLVFVAGMVFFAASALNAQTILYLYTPDPIKIGIYSIPSG